MLPKIKFKCAWTRDEHQRPWTRYGRVPDRVLRARIAAYRRRWWSVGPSILRRLSQITGIRWRERVIICTLTPVYTQADPLLIPPYKDPDWFIHVLTHELIHQLLRQGKANTVQQRLERLHRIHRRYPKNVREHIMVHAIHGIVMQKLLRNGRRLLIRELRWATKYPEYALAWRIARRRGFASVARELRDGEQR